MHTQAAGRLKGRKTPKVVRLVVVYEEFSERELFLLLFFLMFSLRIQSLLIRVKVYRLEFSHIVNFLTSLIVCVCVQVCNV